MELFHGSPAPLSEIRDEGLFGGIFASDREAAEAHGNGKNRIYRIELADADICEDLSDIDESIIASVLAIQTSAEGEQADELARCIIDDEEPAEELWSLLYVDADAASTGWEIQRLRGAIAKAAGYKAVECSDEYGTSYLVLPGTKIEKVA